MRLSQNFVITGAASGIGRELCLQIGATNSTVLAIDLNTEGLEQLQWDMKKIGARVEIKTADVGNRALFESSVQGFDFDVWINNAGIHGNGQFVECSEEFYQKVVNVNLMGVLHGTSIALRSFEKRGSGSIVNVASLSGHIPSPLMSVYSATKHGVVGFTRSLQSELKLSGSNTHVMLVSPGFVRTSILTTDEKMKFPEWLGWTLSSPESVGNAIITALAKKEFEIVPTLNGKIMKKLVSVWPGAALPMVRLALSESPADFLLRRLKRV